MGLVEKGVLACVVVVVNSKLLDRVGDPLEGSENAGVMFPGSEVALVGALFLDMKRPEGSRACLPSELYASVSVLKLKSDSLCRFPVLISCADFLC